MMVDAPRVERGSGERSFTGSTCLGANGDDTTRGRYAASTTALFVAPCPAVERGRNSGKTRAGLTPREAERLLLRLLVGREIYERTAASRHAPVLLRRRRNQYAPIEGLVPPERFERSPHRVRTENAAVQKRGKKYVWVGTQDATSSSVTDTAVNS